MTSRKTQSEIFLWVGVITLAPILTGCGANHARVTQTSTPIHWYTAGVPAARPDLIAPVSHQELPAIAWQWETSRGFSQRETRQGIVPWNRAILPIGSSLTVAWTPPAPPNTVNITIFHVLPQVNHPITPQQVLQTCMVNATYPRSHGCSLSTTGTLRITLTKASQQRGVGLMIAAMWVPTHPAKTSAALDHQAVWIAKLAP